MFTQDTLTRQMAKLKAQSTNLENTCLTTDKATIRLQIPMLGRQKPTTSTRSVRHIEDSKRHFRYSIATFFPECLLVEHLRRIAAALLFFTK